MTTAAPLTPMMAQGQSNTSSLAQHVPIDPLGLIQTIIAFYDTALSILAIILAIFAFIGWQAIGRTAKKNAETVAKKAFDGYIGSDSFKGLLQRQIEQAVVERWQKSLAPALDVEGEDRPAENTGEFGSVPESKS